jgi:hypothetical protein
LIEWWWSWLLLCLGCSSCGRSATAVGGPGSEPGSVDALWIVYAIHTAQYGFIVTAVAFGSLSLWNWWKWRSRAEEAADEV